MTTALRLLGGRCAVSSVFFPLSLALFPASSAEPDLEVAKSRIKSYIGLLGLAPTRRSLLGRCCIPARGRMTKVSTVADSIIGNIELGALREGERLPSEEKLAAQYDVSVGTVQKALAGLANTGHRVSRTWARDVRWPACNRSGRVALPALSRRRRQHSSIIRARTLGPAHDGEGPLVRLSWRTIFRADRAFHQLGWTPGCLQ